MQLTRRSFVMGASATLTAPVLQAQTSDLLQIGGPAFGARWNVTVPAGADPQAIVAAVVPVVEALDMLASPYRADAEISRFNRNQTRHWVPLSPEMLDIIREAKRVAAQTEGAFDPTLGGIVGRFGFGPITTLPAGSFNALEVRGRTVQKADPLQTLDLCGIAKGYALDRVAGAVTALGHRNFFIELGGEVTARGSHPDGAPWRAGVERPLAGAAAVQHIVSIKEEALATSGDAVNGYEFGNRRYGHIIDPRSQQPVDSALASVSVFAPRAITADALATALFAMGLEQGTDLAERMAVPALFIMRDGNSLRSRTTHDFETRMIG